MANLHGHAAGNGGHSQGEPTGTAPALDPTMDSGGAPQGVHCGHCSDEGDDLGVDRWTAHPRPAGKLGPVLAEAAPLPPEDGLGGHDQEGLPQEGDHRVGILSGSEPTGQPLAGQDLAKDTLRGISRRHHVVIATRCRGPIWVWTKLGPQIRPFTRHWLCIFLSRRYEARHQVLNKRYVGNDAASEGNGAFPSPSSAVTAAQECG
jgi:hypothetical protein